MVKVKNNKEVKRVARYSLILETTDDKRYYYDFELGTFVKMEEKTIPKKYTIEKIDFFTANYDSQEQLIECYNVNNPKRIAIIYQFNGEKKIGAAFNNPEWAELAKTYNGQEVDFRNYNNLNIVEDIYNKIMELDEYHGSYFGDYLRFKCNLSPKTDNLINLMVAHERATRKRYRYLMGVKDFETESAISEIYSIDKDAFKQDFRKRMSKYRELRTVYLNYCKLYKNTNKIKTITNVSETKPVEDKKIVKEIQYKQMSMFD